MVDISIQDDRVRFRVTIPVPRPQSSRRRSGDGRPVPPEDHRPVAVDGGHEISNQGRVPAYIALTVFRPVRVVRCRSAVVATIISTGEPGYSDVQINNPHGLVIGPDGALYFSDLDNQRFGARPEDQTDDDHRGEAEPWPRRRRSAAGGAQHAP